MKRDIKRVLFSEKRIRRRVKELGLQLTREYAGKRPLLIGVLKGCYVFLADLARCIDLDCEIRFITATSYGLSTVTTGDVKIGMDFDFDIKGRHVIIIEDILDSGLTLATLSKYIFDRSPASLKVCAMFDKPARRQVPFDADYVGFRCPDEFLVGYGLDCSERYRNLPYVAALRQGTHTKD